MSEASELASAIIGAFIGTLISAVVTGSMVQSATEREVTLKAKEFFCAKENVNNLEKYKDCLSKPAPWK